MFTYLDEQNAHNSVKMFLVLFLPFLCYYCAHFLDKKNYLKQEPIRWAPVESKKCFNYVILFFFEDTKTLGRSDDGKRKKKGMA